MQTKQARWAQRVQAWQSSGLSQAAWCREQALSLSSFGYWRRRLAVVAGPKPLGLLPIRVAAPATPDRLEVRLRNGMVLALPVPTDAAGLEALVRRLSAC